LRLVLRPLCVLAFLALTLPAARAEEVLMLDNGVVLRGRVIRENEQQITIHPAGSTAESRITVDRRRIVKRYVSIARGNARGTVPVGSTSAHTSEPESLPAEPDDLPLFVVEAPGSADLPQEEPEVQEEPFFERLRRVTALALPRTTLGVIVLALLLFIGLAALLTMGARLLGLGLPSLHATWTLALLFGLFVLADMVLHAELLRADRAVWVVPLQAVLWIGLAKALLDTAASRTVVLFAFVLFGAVAVVFVTGAVLVTV
jgi:hypothetical protein